MGMWQTLSILWRAAVSEAWAAWCAGSFPIGAVVVDAGGQIIARGRNRFNDPIGGSISLLSASPFMQTYAPKIVTPASALLEDVLVALHTAFVLGMNHPLAEVMLEQWHAVLPRAVTAGRQLVATQQLAQLVQAQTLADRAINQLAADLDSGTIAP
jgi:hypothetical protein